MNIAIWGAGGIGCYYGARLQKSGHQITYIARGEHLSALCKKGLVIHHEDLSFNGSVTAVSQEQLVADYSCNDFDLIIITLKSTATEALLSQYGHWLAAGQCYVLSLQNGVRNEKLIAEAVGEGRTLGGLAIRIGGHIIAPGVVEAKGPAQVVFGEWPSVIDRAARSAQVTELYEVLNQAGIPTTLSDDIRKELWRKLLINNGVNPLSAMTGLDTKQLTHHPLYGDIVYKMMEETAIAAKDEGVEITTDDVDEMYRLIREFDAIKTSMLVDKEKGRPLELSAICDPVIHGAKAQGQRALFTELVNEVLTSDDTIKSL